MPSTDSIPALHSFAVGELARELDIMPRDVLDELIDAGVRNFWHEGRRLRSVEELKQYLSTSHAVDPLPDLEVDLTPGQWALVAENWQLDGTASPADDCLVESKSTKPLRRFVSSEAALPQAGQQRSGRLG